LERSRWVGVAPSSQMYSACRTAVIIVPSCQVGAIGARVGGAGSGGFGGKGGCPVTGAMSALPLTSSANGRKRCSMVASER
jgi:hypothetical protein